MTWQDTLQYGATRHGMTHFTAWDKNAWDDKISKTWDDFSDDKKRQDVTWKHS